MIVIYSLVLAVMALYSYALVDPNITLLQHPAWIWFREQAVHLGYYQRDLSSIIYIVLITALFALHLVMRARSNSYSPVKIAVISGVLLLVSYPLLTHDLFNYMFDAKIFTFYHQNPYLHRALDFPGDPWLRFMHWVHRPYPYGPTFLPITLVPSFLSFSKFLIDFLLFKALFIGSYIAAVWALASIDRRKAMVYATHPLVLVEGLMNAHNDLLAVSIAFVGIYFVTHKKNLWGRIILLISGGIKYTTLPALLAPRTPKNRHAVFAMTGGIIAALVYLSVKSEIQPWYFITLFTLLPYGEIWVRDLNIFTAGLLYSYYPYVRFGGWDTQWKVDMKHEIILAFAAANAVYAAVKLMSSRLRRRR